MVFAFCRRIVLRRTRLNKGAEAFFIYISSSKASRYHQCTQRPCCVWFIFSPSLPYADNLLVGCQRCFCVSWTVPRAQRERAPRRESRQQNAPRAGVDEGVEEERGRVGNPQVGQGDDPPPHLPLLFRSLYLAPVFRSGPVPGRAGCFESWCAAPYGVVGVACGVPVRGSLRVNRNQSCGATFLCWQ